MATASSSELQITLVSVAFSGVIAAVTFVFEPAVIVVLSAFTLIADTGTRGVVSSFTVRITLW